jgi:gas vesicle protein
MTDSPEEIRARIEATRAELGGDVDALADKVTPSKIVGRQTDKVKGAVGSVKDRVFGAADDVKSSLSDTGSSATGAVAGAKDKVAAKAEGNPLAVGLIAFGVGLLAASLIPASTKEKEVASNLKDQAQPLVDQVTDAAKEVGQNLKEPAQDAAAAVKDAATGAADTVTSEATSAAGEVKDQAQQSKDTVTGS